jgi:hypothetical protein
MIRTHELRTERIAQQIFGNFGVNRPDVFHVNQVRVGVEVSLTSE